MITENDQVNDYFKFMSVPVFRRLSSYSARLYSALLAMYVNCLHKIRFCLLYVTAVRIAVLLHRGIHTLVRLRSKRSTESYNEKNIEELYQNQSALP